MFLAFCEGRGICKKYVFWSSMITLEISMESSRILVTGLPEGTTKTDLTIYFQSTRDSGGGDIKDIHIDDKQAFIAFEDVQVAKRVVGKRKHCFKKCPLIVSLLPEAAVSSETEDEEDDISETNDTSNGNGHHTGTVNDSVRKHSSRANNTNQGAEASLTSRPHDRTTPKSQSKTLTPQQCTVKVTGLLADTSEDLLRNYFENKRRCKGGSVSSVDMDLERQECIITFESPNDAARTVKNSPHKVGRLRLDVSLLEVVQEEFPDPGQEESVDEARIIIIVSGTQLPSEDALWNYFENERRSGGGEILKLVFNDEGDAVITFAEVKDLKQLLEGPHSIDKKHISVMRKPPNKKVPLDRLKVHVQGLNETTSEDCLRFYLEKFSTAEVSEVYRGCRNNALAVFDADPDFASLFDKIAKDSKGLEGKHLRLERVPICYCVHVKGLKKETSEDLITLYFENRRKSGGGRVSHVERKEQDEALVYFEDPSSVENVIKRTHVLEQRNLEVNPHHPFLENETTKKMEIPYDAEVFKYIQLNHEHELQGLLDKHKIGAELTDDSQSPVLTIFPSEKNNDSPQVWQERTEGLQYFLKSFKKIQVPIAAELFDEITRRWREENGLTSTEETPNSLVFFDAHSRSAKIIGREANVGEEEFKLRELINSAEKDTELMKSIVEVEERDIPKSRLTLLKMSSICDRLEKEHQHLNISFDLKTNILRLKGPRSVLQEVKLEVYKFTSKVIEQPLELPTNVMNVLKKPSVLQFTQSLLEESNVQALFGLDEIKSSNEVQVVGVGSKSVADAESLLQNVIQERSLRFTYENTKVLESRKWGDFQSNLTSTFKIEIFADFSSGTLWVCGIVEDVNECFGRIKRFLDVNTVLHKSLPLDEGTTRFLLEKWGSKVDGIKRDLEACCLDMRAASDGEGIEVSGNAEGLQKCLPKLKELANDVQQESIPIEKPGMKKFILQGKGPESLRAIEDRNQCVILKRERNTHEKPFVEVDLGQATTEFKCSYLTKEGKNISVLKGDLTKHRADAIVNAANSQLQHSAGLAAAIVRAGGQEIQIECDEFIRDRGFLLEGHAMVTTAGGLPCDHVIHTVGPRWDPSENSEKKESLLKYAISNCLKRASSLRTIAIPAVSSGKFGFPRDLCAKVILDAVLDFCSKNPFCALSEIHLINNDDPTVLEFVKEMKKRFAGKSTFIDSDKLEVTDSGISTGSRTIQTSRHSDQSTQRIHVTVKTGDLANEKADILVGTAGSDLNLNKNPCARALSVRAGPSLQQECDKKGPVSEGNIAVLSQTGSLKCHAVIFAVCSEWNGGRGKEILKEILNKCLQEADNKNMASVAFAAIGTGILHFPPDQVAEIYFNEVISYDQQHPKTSLRDVRFVVFDSPTIQAFQAAEMTKQKSDPKATASRRKRGENDGSLNGSASFSPIKERRPNHLETTVGSLCFQVQPGDLTNETTDAIAVISNQQLDISASGAGAAILRLGGDSIRRECSRNAPQIPGSVVITTAGNLKARYLYHIVPNASGMKDYLMRCLQEAERNRISSISFPAIGTGNLGVSAKSCAHAMLSAILELSKEKPTALKLVKMTILQEDMIKDIRSAMEEASGVKFSQEHRWLKALGKGFKTVVGALGFKENVESTTAPTKIQDAEDRKLELLIFAGSRRDLQGALKAVSEMMKDNCKQLVVEHEAIRSLTREHMRRIHTLELRYSVEVTVEIEVERILVDGQSDDILQVVGEVHAILHEVKKNEHERSHAEVLSKDVQWKYKFKGNFEDYGGDLNAQIEVAYQEKRSSVVVIQDEKRYEIKFDTMTEEDESNNITEVRRIDLRKDIEFPANWVPQPTNPKGVEETVHLFQLDPTRDVGEYNEVSDKFRQSCSENIIKIERVQNPTLYKQYAVRKQEMDKERARGSNEMSLFHGTKGPKCDHINHKGFNRSFCGENATYYGNGVYFALQAQYSARKTYSPPDNNGHRHMYLAKVLVGEYTLGKQGMITPPAKDTSNLTDTYDTVVDDVSSPTIVVSFYDSQCYPEYLITFE